MNIIVIEDNKIMTDAIKYIIKFSIASEYELLCFSKLHDAKHEVENNSYDLIITDLNLPDSEESQTVKFIHSLDKNKPILLISGSEFLNSENKLDSAENVKFINKDDSFNGNLESALNSLFA